MFFKHDGNCTHEHQTTVYIVTVLVTAATSPQRQEWTQRPHRGTEEGADRWHNYLLINLNSFCCPNYIISKN
jgi:hypothetical protein